MLFDNNILLSLAIPSHLDGISRATDSSDAVPWPSAATHTLPEHLLNDCQALTPHGIGMTEVT